MATYSMEHATVTSIVDEMISNVRSPLMQAMENLVAASAAFHAQNAGEAADGYRQTHAKLQGAHSELVTAHTQGTQSLDDIVHGTRATDLHGAQILGR